MEGKASFIILIAIVAFLSLAIALLAAYVFIVPNHKAEAGTETNHAVVEKPKDEELGKDVLFEEKKVFNIKPDENNKSVMLQITAEIIYFKEVAGIKAPALKLTAYKTEMRELVSTYFMSVGSTEIKSPEGKEKIKHDLVKKLNELLKANEKSKNDIIYNIIFSDWIFM